MNHFDSTILRLVAQLTPDAYGVTIYEAYPPTRFRMGPSFAAIYICLDNLEKIGYVTCREGETIPERGGRRKFYYDITDEGKRIVDEREQRGLLGLRREVAFGTMAL